MVSVADAVGLLVILGINTAVAALLTRFFRVRLATQWGSALYAVVITPVVLLVSVLVLGGFLGLGPDLGSGLTVIVVTILLPLSVGIAFDYFWMPSPEEVDLPETS
ncbi:hypothetical protein BRC83_01475 [Halobacteriales archaeon QS_1_68_17]|nr:MAG: hypothetical protein BRC83_01475 [Halobacteriales archaeon QS_1_68_17]